MSSPRWPIAGTILVWSVYAVWALVRSDLERGRPAPVPVSGPLDPFAAAETDEEAPPPVEPSPADVLPDEAVARVAGDPGGRATDDEPPLDVSPEDRELLGALRCEDSTSEPPSRSVPARSDSERCARALTAFVAAHPEHAVGRALLVAMLLAADAPEETIRTHAQALRALVPEQGFPDVLLARLEARAGRGESAAALLIEAGGKDLSWIPESRLLALAVSAAVSDGLPPVDALAKTMSLPFPSLLQVRQLVGGLLGSGAVEDGPAPETLDDPRLRVAAARAAVRLGAALEDHGLTMVQNLVGAATAALAMGELEKAGELGLEYEALRRRNEILKREPRLVGSIYEEAFFTSSPELMAEFLRDLAVHGELRACRRALMTYLAR